MMKIYLMEVETDAGRRSTKPPAPIEVDATAEVMPSHFRGLTEDLWNKAAHGRAAHSGREADFRAARRSPRDAQKSRVKVFWIEVETDAGRRVVKLAAPIEVDATSEVMPVPFRGLTEVLWNVVREVARQAPEAPKAQA